MKERTDNTSRDTFGRYSHEWGWQGFDLDGREWSACNHCDRWRCDLRLIAEGGGPPELFSVPLTLLGDSPMNDWIHGVQP